MRLSSPVATAVVVVLSANLVAAAVHTVNCNGTADSRTITEALAMAGSGDTISVEPCSIEPFGYRETLRILDRTEVQLVAGDALAFDAGGAIAPTPTVFGLEGLPCIQILRSHRVLVRGIDLEGCGDSGVAVEYSEGVDILRVKVTSAGQHGVEVVGSRSVRLASNTLLRNGAAGVSLGDCLDCLVMDNVTFGNAGQGVQIRGASDVNVGRNESYSNRLASGFGGADGDIGAGCLTVGGCVSVAGPLAIGKLASEVPLGVSFETSESISSDAQLISEVLDGVPPLVVRSSTGVENLNADLLDGEEAAEFRKKFDPITTDDILDGTILGIDVADGTLTGAKIAEAEIAGSNIATETIMDANVAANAAIQGTKVLPVFGDQDITTAGDITTLGNLGIGRTSPAAPLHYGTSLNVSLRLEENENGEPQLSYFDSETSKWSLYYHRNSEGDFRLDGTRDRLRRRKGRRRSVFVGFPVV